MNGSDIENCAHNDIAASGKCRYCNQLVIEEMTYIEIKNNTISDSLEDIPIKKRIKIKSISIYKKFGRKFKMPKRKKAACYCVIRAYQYYEIVIDPVIIGKMFGYKRTDLSNIIKDFSEIDPYVKKNRYTFYIDERDMILYYCEYFSLLSYKDDLMEKFDIFVKNFYDPIEHRSSREFTLSFIYAYIVYMSLDMDIQDIISTFDVSDKIIVLSNNILPIIWDM